MNLFITGTDTGVGKTLVSAILACKLGYKYWKPIQSGLDFPTDSQWVGEKLGQDVILKEAYQLTQPFSPHISARLDNIKVDTDFIVQFKPMDKTIIEGAGGLLVPLNTSMLMVDLISALHCPTLLVARSGLGTINHTLLSLEALRSRNIDIAGVVLVGALNEENKQSIELYGNIAVVGQIPILANLDFTQIQMAGNKFLNLEKIKWI